MKILIVTDAWTPQINGVVRTIQMTVRELRPSGTRSRSCRPTCSARSRARATPRSGSRW